MSWYVGLDGRQVWVDREETVYTLGEPLGEEELPRETLSYLTSNSSGSKAVYAEHMIDDDCTDKKGKKKVDKMAGRQRGFVVRVDTDSRTKVTSVMQPAADFLVDAKVLSRIDVDDSDERRGKRRGKKKEEAEKEPEEEILPPLGPNECRVETRARCQHFAHGHGFRVDILELGSRQRLHMFTAEEMPPAEWHRRLVEAVQAGGVRVALGRMAGGEDQSSGRGGQQSSRAGGAAAVAPAPPPPKAGAQAKEQEEDWMDMVFGQRMVPKKDRTQGAGAGATGEAAEGEKEEGEGCEGSTEPAPKPKRERQLPPWLRR